MITKHIALALLVCLAAPRVLAQGFESYNQSSFARAAALPGLGQGAVVPRGESINSVNLDWSNEFFLRSNAHESLTQDSETQRVTLRYRAGIEPVRGHAMEWSLELPLLFTGGGVLDALIENWHSAFGLPNANRSDVPRDQYHLRYVRDGVTLIDRSQGGSGLGDAQLGLGLALSQRWTLRGMAKLPTGDADKLTGGHYGGALWLDYSLPLTASRRAALLLSGGVSAQSTNGPLSGLQQPLSGLAGVVLILPIYAALDGVVQVNAHTRLYKDTHLGALSRAAAPLSFGFRLPYQRFIFDFAAVEDASVNASPDFGFFLSVKVKAYGAR